MHPKMHLCTFFMKVSAILKGKKDDQDRKPIAIRISNGQQRTFKTIGFRVTKAQFDKGKVKNHPNATAINAMIKDEIYKAEKGLLFKAPQVTFKSYCLQCFNEWEKQKSYETLRHYQTDLNKWEDWSPGKHLQQIDLPMLNKYKAYLYSINGPNTVWRGFKFLRMIIGKAHREGLIEKNPFLLFEKPAYKEVKKLYLVKEEVEEINKVALNEDLPKEIRFVANWFLIGCYTGLRYSDMHNFSKARDIVGERLTVHTQKTGEVISLPLLPHVKELFERVEYKNLTYANQPYNRLLKQVASIAGINKPVSGHSSRHSFATLAASAGISIEVTAKLLGHNSIRTTAVYFKLTGKMIDDEFRKLK